MPTFSGTPATLGVDGKYCTLVQFKQFLLGTRTDPNNPSVFNQQVIGTPDDNVLSNILLACESAFELHTGTGYDQQTYSAVQAFMPFVDVNGWLHLYARERGPVTAVSNITFRDIMFGGSTTWQAVTFDAVNDIVYPPFSATDTHPLPESWHIQVWPNPAMSQRATGQLLVKWTYTGGFATIPQALTTLIARMAMYQYKLREMPAGKVINQPLGTLTVPSDFPPDIRRQIELWSPRYA